jgi:molybdopterin molybdotransferase
MSSIEQIAAALQGYDPKALSAAHVNAFLAQLVKPVTTTEPVGVFEALGRVLAEDVVSPISVPPHDNSAMDGFAFDGALLQAGQPLTLQLAEGTAFAGKAWVGSLVSAQCVKIMTGAIMPAGLDTVVPLEFVKIEATASHSARYCSAATTAASWAKTSWPASPRCAAGRHWAPPRSA